MKTSIVLALALAAGCYGSAPPPPPRVPLPELRSGAEVEVFSEETTRMESVPKKAWHCPAGHAEGSAACTTSTYTEREPVTHISTTARYLGEELNGAQLAVMADNEHEVKRKRLAELSDGCQSANFPRRVGLAGVIGGLVLWGIAAATQEKVFTYVGVGALGLGGGSYAYGYFAAGGRKCNEARAVANDLMAEPSGEGELKKQQYEELARRFNDRVTSKARSASSL